jgi:hypothetical protein
VSHHHVGGQVIAFQYSRTRENTSDCSSPGLQKIGRPHTSSPQSRPRVTLVQKAKKKKGEKNGKKMERK